MRPVRLRRALAFVAKRSRRASGDGGSFVANALVRRVATGRRKRSSGTVVGHSSFWAIAGVRI